jgi:hypothetical protein
MADEFVLKCELAANGQSITNFKSFTENPRDINKVVKLMNKTGFAGLTPRYQFGVDYVVPQSGATDFSGFSNGTFTATLDGGTVVRYTGVYILNIGESKIDGENEMIRPLTFGATDRTED